MSAPSVPNATAVGPRPSALPGVAPRGNAEATQRPGPADVVTVVVTGAVEVGVVVGDVVGVVGVVVVVAVVGAWYGAEADATGSTDPFCAATSAAAAAV